MYYMSIYVYYVLCFLLILWLHFLIFKKLHLLAVLTYDMLIVWKSTWYIRNMMGILLAVFHGIEGSDHLPCLFLAHMWISSTAWTWTPSLGFTVVTAFIASSSPACEPVRWLWLGLLCFVFRPRQGGGVSYISASLSSTWACTLAESPILSSTTNSSPLGVHFSSVNLFGGYLDHGSASVLPGYRHITLLAFLFDCVILGTTMIFFCML